MTHVEAVNWVKDYSCRIVLDTGRELFSTPTHRWLSRERGGSATKWRKTADLRPGDVLRRFADPWGSQTLDDAWYGGLIDGKVRLGPNIMLVLKYAFRRLMDVFCGEVRII